MVSECVQEVSSGLLLAESMIKLGRVPELMYLVQMVIDSFGLNSKEGCKDLSEMDPTGERMQVCNHTDRARAIHCVRWGRSCSAVHPSVCIQSSSPSFLDRVVSTLYQEIARALANKLNISVGEATNILRDWQRQHKELQVCICASCMP